MRSKEQYRQRVKQEARKNAPTVWYGNSNKNIFFFCVGEEKRYS
jgi:hypothetical protein